MASEVDIANLALGHLGDNATVASLNPPEGSVQAEHCQRFYPIARDTLLEMHSWGFATRRIQLAQLSSGYPEWDYAYAMPSDALRILAILPSDATDDYATAVEPFSCEISDAGARIIYSDRESATARYVASIEDATKFSPLFVIALSWHLASMLAGPVIKGAEGAAEAKRCAAMMQSFLNQAMVSDSNQRKATPAHSVPWMVSR